MDVEHGYIVGISEIKRLFGDRRKAKVSVIWVLEASKMPR